MPCVLGLLSQGVGGVGSVTIGDAEAFVAQDRSSIPPPLACCAPESVADGKEGGKGGVGLSRGSCPRADAEVEAEAEAEVLQGCACRLGSRHIAHC